MQRTFERAAKRGRLEVSDPGRAVRLIDSAGYVSVAVERWNEDESSDARLD
jgi:hypothetical protein